MSSLVTITARLRQTASRWITDQSGATAIEYGLMLALISLAIFASIQGLGSSIADVATRLVTTLSAMIS